MTDEEDGVWLTIRVDNAPKRVQVIRTEQSDGGAPRKVVTEDGERYIEHMASKGCALRDIAYEMCVSDRTFYADHNKARVQEAYRRGSAKCDNRLRAAQVARALDGNATMLVWLGKVRLGQRDESSVEVVVRDKDTITFEELDGMFGDEDDTLQGS